MGLTLAEVSLSFHPDLTLSNPMRRRSIRIPLFLLAFLLALSRSSNSKSPANYLVYRIHPRSWAHVRTVSQLDAQNARRPGQVVDVMVSEEESAELKEIIRGIPYNVTIPDVHKMILDLEHSSQTRSEFDKRFRDDPMDPGARDFERLGQSRAEYRFGEYSSYSAMVRYLRTLEFYYPQLVRLIRIGTSHEGRPIEGVKIGFPVSSVTKRAVWIDGNIHAREWASSHTALFVINQLVTGYANDDRVTFYLNNLNFFIVPCLNPDGYEYSRSSALPQIRLWRKNRSPERCMPTQWGGIRCCQGVDLNRNFGFHWAETGSSENPCSNLYAGEYAFSEPETSAVSSFLQSSNLRGKLDAFITLHTYAQMWIHPYSHIRHRYTHDYEELKEVAERAVHQIHRVYGTEYQVGTGADLLSPAAGGSDDWAKDYLGAKFVYLLELRPQNNIKNGFILDRTELLPVGIETLEGMKEVFDAVLRHNSLRVPWDSHGRELNVSVSNLLDIRRLRAPATQRLNTVATIPSQYPTTTPTTTSTTRWTTTVSTTTTRVTAQPSTAAPTTLVTTTPTTSTSTTPSTSEAGETPTEASLGTDLTTDWPFTLSSSLPRNVSQLSVEGRHQLSEELLKKQLMRLQNLSQLQTTPTTAATPKSCTDRKYSCAFWISADKNACQSQKRFMQRNCAFSCSFCSLN